MVISLEWLAEPIRRNDVDYDLYEELMNASSCKPVRNYTAMQFYCKVKDQSISGGYTDHSSIDLNEELSKYLIRYIEGQFENDESS